MKILINQGVIQHYRVPVFLPLLKKYTGKLEITCGEYSYNKKSYTDSKIVNKVNLLKNKYFFKGRLLWQSGLLKKGLAADLLIIGNDYRYISTWGLVVLRKLLNKKTIIWGHISGKSSFGYAIRYILIKCSIGFICYTKSQKEKLQLSHPKLPIWVTNNSCLARRDCNSKMNIDEYNIIYVGRLVKEKKIFDLVEFFVQGILQNKFQQCFRLLIIGKGAEKERIEKYIDKFDLNVKNRISLLGEIVDRNRLKKIYHNSFFSISPGYVGLSVIQSFGFGVPMMISKYENHSPEIEVFMEGFNGVYYTDVNDFYSKLNELYNSRSAWLDKRNMISENIKKNYVYENMVETFISAINYGLK